MHTYKAKRRGFMVQCRHCSRLCRVAWGPKADKKHMFEQQAKLLSFFLSSVPVPPPFADDDEDTLENV